MRTIPEVLFEEFKNGDVIKEEKFACPLKHIAAVSGFDRFYLIFIPSAPAYSEVSCLKVMYGDIDCRETVFNHEVLDVGERWHDIGTWGYGSGNLLRKSLIARFGVLHGTHIYGKTGELVTKVLSRAHELSKERSDFGEEKWSQTNLERPADVGSYD